MTLGIFVSYNAYFKPVADITMPVLAEYCRRYGYTLDVRENPTVTRTLVWDRALTMLANLDRFDFTVARDHTGLNDGMIFNRNAPRIRWLWEHLWSMDGEVSSLAATWRFIRETPQQTIIGEVPQKLLHSYPYPEYGIDYPEGTWEPGDFCYHLPAMTTDRRVSLFRPMLERIIR